MIWIEKTDPDGNKMLELENNSITCSFFEDDEADGCIVDNHTTGIITWNSEGITHLNLQTYDFTIMVGNDDLITMSYGKDHEKNLIFYVEDLVTLIKEKGKTIEELEKEMEERENERESESDNRTDNTEEELS